MNELGPVQSNILTKATRIQLGKTCLENLSNGRRRVGGHKKPIPDENEFPLEEQENREPIDTPKENVQDYIAKMKGRFKVHGEYAYVAPAAKRYYLWDSTHVGRSFTFFTKMHDEIQLQQTALSACLSTIERHGFLQQPGFFLGQIVNDTERMILDRYDMGREGAPTMRLLRDMIVKVSKKRAHLRDQITCTIEKDIEDLWTKYHYSELVKFYKHTTAESLPSTNDAFLIHLHLDPLLPHSVTVQASRLIPKISFNVNQIPSIRVVPNLLWNDLVLQKDVTTRHGYMTIDQARHILMLQANDGHNFDWSMIGFWIKGVTHVYDPVVRHFAISFASNSYIHKMDTGKNSFLICLVQEEPLFYEVRYESLENDFWLQSSGANLLDEVSGNVSLTMTEREVSLDKDFCEAYKDAFDIDLYAPPEEEWITPALEAPDEEEILSMNEHKDLAIVEAEEAKEDAPLEDISKEPILVEPVKLACPETPSIQDQQWLYLNLLQQQLDILRAQMGVLQPVMKVEKMNAEQKPVALSIGTNTSFVISSAATQPQMTDQECQVDIPALPVHTQVSILGTDTMDIPPFDSHSQLPTDTGSNYKPFFEMMTMNPLSPFQPIARDCEQKVAESATTTDLSGAPAIGLEDSPETSFSKEVIAKLASNPNQSFIFMANEQDAPLGVENHPSFPNQCSEIPSVYRHQDSSNLSLKASEQQPSLINQGVPSSVNTTGVGFSFASQEYLRRHGLLNESVVSMDPSTRQSSVSMKPPRAPDPISRVLDLSRIQSLGKLL